MIAETTITSLTILHKMRSSNLRKAYKQGKIRLNPIQKQLLEDKTNGSR